MTARITSLETADGREDEAAAEDVETVWSRAVGNVAVNVTIHPKDGKRDDTRSVTVNVPGDYEFVVGETEAFGDEEVEIEGLVVRATPPSTPRNSTTPATWCTRRTQPLYVRDESTTRGRPGRMADCDPQRSRLSDRRRDGSPTRMFSRR